MDDQVPKLPRLFAPGSDPLDVLRTVGTYGRYLAEVERRAVRAARAAGRSWEDIGDALGVTRQAAWGRFGRTADLSRLAAIQVAMAGPVRVRLQCPGCEAGQSFDVAREGSELVARSVAGGPAYPLPGPVGWTCGSCGASPVREVSLPPDHPGLAEPA